MTVKSRFSAPIAQSLVIPGFVLTLMLLAGCGSSEHPEDVDGGAMATSPRETSQTLLGLLDATEEVTGERKRDELSDLIALTKDDTIFTISARTVDFNGQALVPRVTLVRASNLFDGNDDGGDPLDRELTVVASTVQGVIGINEDLTLSLTVPYLVKSLKTRIAGQRTSLNSDGFGDIPLIAKWRFFKAPELGGTTEVALLGGVKLPTGRFHERDVGMRLPRPLQPGSGSVDGLLGVAFTRLWDGGRWLINADTVFQLNTEAEDYRFGNRLRFDVGAQYRIHPERYESYDQTTVNLLLEFNGEYGWKDELNGHDLDATGGLQLFVSPGVQVIVSEDLLFEVGVQIPVYRDLNGPQLGVDFRATAGLRWRF
ncbi:MAG TPA: transporter [Planctomycetes bacterium]|nr:transporter [Planctomycetota bacterium]